MNEALEVWSIRETSDKSRRAIWKHAGRAFVNQDGSINVLLDVLPIDGKLQVRRRRESDAEVADKPRSDAKPEAATN